MVRNQRSVRLPGQILVLATIATVLGWNELPGLAAAERPNVVFILIDDLGWSDLGCYGSDFYETPHIDRFAGQSLLFRQAYAAAPVCSPTRAAIMTGKWPARLDMTIWHEGAVDGGPKNRKLLAATAVPNLPREEATLAELFRDAGYYTAHVGKWHLGTAAYYPETQGFDQNIGGTFWGAPSTFFYPFAGRWNQRDPELRYVPGLAPSKPGDYLPDRLTDEALEVIEANRDRPFFLNLWYYTVHSPIEAPEDLVERFRNKRPGQVHSDPTYAAMVHRMDWNVGRVLAKLDELNLADNTIVVVTSDNGGVDFDTRSIVPTSNDPLRSGKGTLYEGGIRVPLLIRWPGKRTGTSEQMCCSTDFYPTFAELLGRVANANAAASPVDGVSLFTKLDHAQGDGAERPLFWHFPHYYPRMTPASAVRAGDWKLITYYEDDRQELFDLSSDLGEQANLVSTAPEIAARLDGQLRSWLARVDGKLPTPNDGTRQNADTLRSDPPDRRRDILHRASRFLGNWALEMPDGAAGWLTLTAREGQPHGELWTVGSGRQLSDLLLDGNTLGFVRNVRVGESEFEGGPPTGPRIACRYSATVDGDRMRLVMHRPAQDGKAEDVVFRGRRMPPLPPKPDLSTVQFGEPIQLFNGRDLDGWKLTNPHQINGWKAIDGLLVNTTPKLDFAPYSHYGNLRTIQEFEDFRLQIEFQVPAGGNSGIYLRGIYEVQVLDRDSRMQGIQGVGSIFGRIAPSANAGKVGGDWNSYDITLVDRHVTVILNGTKVIDNMPIGGCTNGALHADETIPGPLYLQGDHTAVSYRNIVLRPVIRRNEQ